MGLNLFNKIINLEFLDDGKNVVAAIKCPKKGRKPSIEINAQFTAGDTMALMNIKVRNLDLAEIGSNFPAVRVTAGYDDSTVSFLCSIFSMYQESPGPESSTVIMAYIGKFEPYLLNTVSGLVQEGGSLEDAVKLVSDALDFAAPVIDKKAAKLKTDTQLCLDGTAREALKKIKTAFPTVAITVADDRLKVFLIDEPPKNAVARIRYMSAPVQLTGGKDCAVGAVVTAPWVPSLRCSEPVEISTEFFNGKGGVSKNGSQTIIIPDRIDVQFATTGTANKMVITAHVNKQGE